MTEGFLAGLRVVEVADEHGEYCGRVLAGLGADVVKVEPPGGERTRRYGPFLDGVPGPDRSLTFWHYNLGKRGVVVDLDGADHHAGRERLRRLLGTADVVLDARAGAGLAGHGLGYDDLAADHPGLVLLRITPFGEDGPWASYAGSDLVHLALGGVVMNCGYDPEPTGRYDLPPVAPQMWQAYHVAGEMGVIAVLGALVERLSSGRGQRLSLAVHEAVSKSTELDLPNWIYARAPQLRQTCRHSARPDGSSYDLPWIAMTKDGRWLNPYRTYLQRGRAATDMTRALERLLQRHEMTLGLSPEEVTDEVRGSRPEVRSHVNALTDRLIAGYRYDREVWRDAQEEGMPWAPLRRPEENLGEEHWSQRGTFAEVDHPELGRSFTYVARRWVCDQVPWRVGPRAPLLGEHDALLDEPGPPVVPPLGDGSEPVTGPHGSPFALAGVKVVDLSWMVASGGAGRFLACLGADVVKVEHASRPDATRMSQGRPPVGLRAERERLTAPAPATAGAGLNRSGFFMDMCAGKRSLSLNIKTPEGREVLERMVSEADLVIEGFSPGTMDRMGFGYERLRELNPAVVYVQQSGLGQRGTYGSMRCYGPTAQAFAGLSEMSGLPEPLPPAGIGYSYLDWFGAYNMATAMLAGLHRQRVTGQGCWIDSSQVETGLYLTGTALLEHSAHGTTWERRGNRDRSTGSVPHGVFPTSGEDRWIAIACRDDGQWESLRAELGIQARPEWHTGADRAVAEDEVEAAVATATASREGYDLMARLQVRGVPAGVCQSAEDRCDHDPQLRHLGWLVELEQSELGRWPVKELPVRFSRTPAYMGGRVDRSGPNYGEDTEDVLRELGYDDAAVARLRGAGAL